MTEWRDIPGYVGRYQVSDDGQVRTLLRYYGKILVQFPTFGYPSVALRQTPSSRTSNQFVHRLVALAFLSDSQADGRLVLHCDGDPTNNHVSNLRWGTHSDNTLDAVRHGTHAATRKTHCIHGHPFDEENTIVVTLKDRRPHRACRACKNACDRRRYRRAKRSASATECAS